MGRSIETMSIGDQINAEYHSLDLPVDMFIEEQVAKRCGFDIRYLEETPAYGGHSDHYAHFHIVHGGQVLTLYYWQSRDCWFCKS